MALNYVWIAFIVIAFIVAVLRTIGFYFRTGLHESFGWDWVLDHHNATVFNDIVHSTFEMAQTSIEISIYLVGIMALWMGIMKIGERGGAIKGMSSLFSPLFKRIFPDLPQSHPAYGSMIMNFSANMLGLDNAATPLGLKAMNQLQEINPNKEVASNAQIMFLVLNTSGLTLIPVSVMGLRAAAGAANPADIFIPILLATYCSTLAGLLIVGIKQRINLLNPIILAYLLTITCVICSIIWLFHGMNQKRIGVISSVAGNAILFSIIALFVSLAMIKRVNVYEAMIDGAKEGIGVAVKIIPFLVAILVAIGIFRASGAMDIIIEGIKAICSIILSDLRFVDALPTAFMKPLSGSGARGMMVEAMHTFGPDSFVGRLSSTIQGSTETTFYVLAVYFGSVGIKRTRYALTAGLLADLAGVIAAIVIAYIFWG